MYTYCTFVVYVYMYVGNDCLDCFPLSCLESSHVMCVYMYKCLSPSCEHTCSRGPCMYMCSISSFLSVLLLGLLHIIQIYMYLDKMTSSSCLSSLYACTTCCHFSVHIHCKWMCGCGNIFSAYCVYNVHGYDNFTTPVIACMGVSPPSLAAFVSHLNYHYISLQ